MKTLKAASSSARNIWGKKTSKNIARNETVEGKGTGQKRKKKINYQEENQLVTNTD